MLIPENFFWIDFMIRFIEQTNLTQNAAVNIKRSRATVSREIILKFFDDVKKKLSETTPVRIFNFDKTNITNDPAAKWVLEFREPKRVEWVKVHSKAFVSTMFGISAARAEQKLFMRIDAVVVF